MAQQANENWKLSIVSPVYNEADTLPQFVDEVTTMLDQIQPPGGAEIILVNDGSHDNSAAILDRLATEHPGRIKAVHLSRNFGMEPAIQAGLSISSGDAIIILDADLQDDPAAFTDFIKAWQDGNQVAYAVRSSREEGPLQRALFWTFYRLLSWIAHIDLPLDASNFALMDRRVVDTLLKMPESNRFLRGLRAWTGFKQIGIPVARRKREHGQTRLGLRGQWRLAMNAIFSFSYVPLFCFRLAGALSIVLCMLLIFWALYAKLITGIAVDSWASLFIVTTFFGGVNLLGIGIIGEYVARIHDDVKGRPNFIIDRVNGDYHE